MKIISCKAAKEKGETRYFTGRPCPQGHISERIVSTRACALCASERKSRWNQENPERVNAQKRDWRDRNIDKARKLNLEGQKRNRAKANERNRRYAAAHRDELKQKNADWGKNNPGKVLAKAAKYRAAKLKATPLWADFNKISRAYEMAAEYRAKGIDVEVDHIIPLQGRKVCGLHVQGNLQIVDMQYNRTKANIF